MKYTINLKVFLLLVFILNLIQGIFTPIIDDEAYYWKWSQRLDFGFFDHPPMIATWIKLSDFIFDHEIGARIFTIILNTLAAYFYWQIANPSTRKEKAIFALLYFSIPLIQIFTFVSTPDAPLLFFTILYLYILKQYIGSWSLKWGLLLGICFAGIMYSKYHGVLLLAFTLLPIINHLYNKTSFYIAILFSLILYIPHFYWLYQHNFPPISYHFVDRSAEQIYSIADTLAYIGTAIIAFAGLLFIYIGSALKQVDFKNSFQKSLFWLVIGPFLFFFFSTFKDSTQAQWLLISYIALGILVYNYIITLRNAKWFYILSSFTILLLVAARIVMMIPSTSPLQENKDFANDVSTRVSTKIVAFERYQEASIFEFYNRDKQGVVYRTLGNRNSQYTIWNDESLLNQEFTFVSPWLNSEIHFTGLKGLMYYVNPIKKYIPIHEVEADFIKLDSVILKDKVVDIRSNQAYTLEILVSRFDIDLLKHNNYKLSLFLTQNKQYNIVDEVEIPIESLVVSDNLISTHRFKFNFKTNIKSGNYVAYIGITPNNTMTKFQSKPLKIIVTE